MKALTFLGERDGPDSLEKVAARRPIIGTGERPKELLEMEHVVLFPHLGSSTEVTRAAMDQLVVDNIRAWLAGKPPLTPVPETPYPPKR